MLFPSDARCRAVRRRRIISRVFGHIRWFNNVAGNMVCVLGPKWRIHEYIHLQEVIDSFGDWMSIDEQTGQPVEEIMSFTYELDSKGYISKIHICYSTGELSSYTFTWK